MLVIIEARTCAPVLVVGGHALAVSEWLARFKNLSASKSLAGHPISRVKAVLLSPKWHRNRVDNQKKKR